MTLPGCGCCKGFTAVERSFGIVDGRRLRRRLRIVVLLGVAFGVLTLLVDLHVTLCAGPYIYEHASDSPEIPVALVLGTAKYHGTARNHFYQARIEAAAELFHGGRVRGLLVSGDHGRLDYDEPGTMRADLIALGVPASCITLDHAGFRTLDSVVRAWEVFGQRRIIVISQRFHVERAVYLARAHGIDAYGYCAVDASGWWQLKVRAREVLARTKAVADVLSGKEPRFLGEPVEVSLRR